MKKNVLNIITQEELFNISLLGFTIALQMNPSFIQLALYLLFIVSSLLYLQARLLAYKKQAQSLLIFVFDFVRTISLPVSLAFIGMAYSYQTFWLTFFGVSFTIVYSALVWAFWNVKDEE
ncbi:hypothetical protein GCM10009347_38640 [Shewanella algicola]|uniref:Uncharacterized protein n=1 Tax=Shewanella algicola TaxID=640633 RepID=A0A9X1Z800_9GAMM|nr:hypothetical protein [Shewanella algicola]MCL1107505.1 hypothetical protein [Shewanella algicola]GGP69717.1 hypothetical protein GCM10009347_38640 [Shewanella algicola]